MSQDEFPYGVFFVLVAKPDDLACKGSPSQGPALAANEGDVRRRLKTVDFTLEAKITEDEYLAATFGALCMFLAVYLFVVLISCVICLKKIRYPELDDLDQSVIQEDQRRRRGQAAADGRIIYSSIEEAPNNVLDDAIVDLEQQIRRHEAEEQHHLQSDENAIMAAAGDAAATASGN